MDSGDGLLEQLSDLFEGVRVGILFHFKVCLRFVDGALDPETESLAFGNYESENIRAQTDPPKEFLPADKRIGVALKDFEDGVSRGFGVGGPLGLHPWKAVGAFDTFELFEGD